VDLERFSPAPKPERDGLPPVRLVTVANYSERKNVAGVVAGLIQARQLGGGLEFDWFGANSEIELCDQARRRIRDAGMESALRLNGQTQDPAAVFRGASAVLLGSFAEGLPNAVCEAMACGLPVLMSDVSDARYLVEDGVNGFLFDPHQPAELADRIGRFAALRPAQREAMGHASRRKAEKLFDRHHNTGQYLELLDAARRRRGGCR
jgi:glycosyltransferase involved in cell wall biosynthesis